MTLIQTLRTLSRLTFAAGLAVLTGHVAAQFSQVDRLVTFGSSLSDTGGAFVWLSQPGNEACGVRLNVPPYDLLDDNLTPEGPYARGGHHVTNGATWIEGLARHLSLGGDARTALRQGEGRGSNYAVFGARAGDYACRFSLPQQVARYMANFKQTSPDTLVALEVGSNDVRDALVAAAGGNDPAAVLSSAVASLYAHVTLLYEHGSRKFLFVNVPDIGKTPAVRQMDAMYPGLGLAAAATYLSQQYNAALDGVIQYTNAIGGEARLLVH